MLSVDGPVKQRLDTLAGELAKAADKELQVGTTAQHHAYGNMIFQLFLVYFVSAILVVDNTKKLQVPGF